MMTPDTAQGLSAELRFALKEGWSFTQEPIDCVSDHQQALMEGRIFESWYEARSGGSLSSSPMRTLVAYADFVSIARQEDGSYTVISRSGSGSSFEIIFDMA